MGTLTNGPVQNKPFLFKTEDGGATQVQMVGLDAETVAAIGAASSGSGGSTVDRELRTTDYIANTAGTGYSIGDAVVRADVYDVTTSTPSLIATIWFNATTGNPLGTAPTQANLTFVGTKDASTETTLAYMSATQGAISDAAATSDTGSFSIIAFWKRLLGKFPSIGPQVKAASLSVTLASDQGSLAVSETQGTPTEVAAVAASTTIATLLAASAGRRRFIALNPSTSTGKVGLSTSNAATFASCAIVLSAGDMWVESLAAASAWYVIMDTSTASVPVQTVS